MTPFEGLGIASVIDDQHQMRAPKRSKPQPGYFFTGWFQHAGANENDTMKKKDVFHYTTHS